MTQYTAAIIGAGADPDDKDLSGFSMGYTHAEAYETLPQCDLVGCADIVESNARAFVDTFGLDESAAYTDYQELIEELDPDIISITVPPAIHADIVIGAIKAGPPRAIHCEKPMDLTWRGSRQMAEVAWRHDVQLTFNHQRRFTDPWMTAKECIDEGTIGEIERIETSASNLFDWGTHVLDLCSMYVGEVPANWVMGQIDYREESLAFGAHQDNQSIVRWEYENGVQGVAVTGNKSGFTTFSHEIYGEEGTLKVQPWSDEETIVVRQHEDETFRGVQTHERGNAFENAIENVVECIDGPEESPLRAKNALIATEIIFSAYESARRRGRVDCPLDIDDNPLEFLVSNGELPVKPDE